MPAVVAIPRTTTITVRSNTIRALALVKAPGLDHAAAEMVEHAAPQMRLSGVWAASLLRPEVSLPLLKQAASDQNPGVRMKVVQILGTRRSARRSPTSCC